MKSAASFRGRPIHPMLMPFPFAFLTGALLFDVLGWWLGNMDLAYSGRHLTVAGIVAGVGAAIPGAIDFFKTIPAGTPVKRRAARHALLNITALVLFAVSYQFRDDGEASITTMGLEGAGVVVMSAAGYLGGTLVYRDQVGVNPR